MKDPDQLLLDGISDYAILYLNLQGRISHWSASARKLFGYEAKDITELHYSVLSKSLGEGPLNNDELEICAAHGRFEDAGWRVRQDGSAFLADCILCPLRDDNAQLEGYSLIVHDITEQQKAADSLRAKEAELSQARRMESVGRLAGGVAHDFNNYITGIMGLAEEIRQSMNDQDPRRADLDEIIKTSKKASDLTRELLAFGRKQISQPRVINLNTTLREKKNLLIRLLGPRSQLHLDLDPSIRHILMDPAHLDQLLFNMVINARDAMPQGGTVQIKTDRHSSPVTTPEMESANPQLILEISDTGVGMEESVLPHIFEPFFTTKDQGKGSGMGLATVYGIVKQNRGDIQVESRLGKGTRFILRFPEIDVPAERVESSDSVPEPREPSTETLLLVEDTFTIQRVMTHALQHCGYRVLATSSGEEALSLADGFKENIHLLVSDVMMPGMNGFELARQLNATHPEARTLFITGYSPDLVQPNGLEKSGAILQKPFTSASLIQKVREVLDQEPRLVPTTSHD